MLFQQFRYPKQLTKIAQPIFGNIISVKRINGGFYGLVFLLKTSKAPETIIAKVYYKTGFMALECTQLNLLRKFALTKVPEIYKMSEKAENGYFDVMFMEYLDGVNGSQIKNATESEKERLRNQITDNLLAIHSVKNPEGFGELTAKDFASSWETYYKRIVEERINFLHSKKRIPKKITETANFLYDNFDKVFSQTVGEASLIHGDYNMWNLMVDPDTKQLIGMIDPMGCSYSDSVLDLFQLENANGNDFGLIDCYMKKTGLGEEIYVKNGFYGFFDDVKHYQLSGLVDIKHIIEYGNQALKYL